MSDRPEILQIDPLLRPVQKRIEADFTVHRLTDVEALSDIAPRIRGIATNPASGVPPEVMAALPNLEIIAVNGVGLDQIDLDTCEKRGIRVATALNVLTDDVADLAIGLMIDVLRGLSAGDRFVRAGKWPTEKVPNSRAISGKTVGIVGLGQIGEAIAERCAALKMTVAYYNRSPRPKSPFKAYPDVQSLAEAVDVLILAVPGGNDTTKIVDDAVLNALGPNGYLVNIARGSVVDEAALILALQEERLAGAGLDVFAHEPHVPQALIEMDNVVLQAHRGSATVEVRTAMATLVVDNLAAHFEGKPLLTAVL